MLLETVRAAITPEMLVAADYCSFDDPARVEHHYVASYQKRFCDNIGIMFVLHFTLRRFFYPTHDLESMTAWTQFQRGATAFDVAVAMRSESLEYVEHLFRQMWRAMNFDHTRDA